MQDKLKHTPTPWIFKTAKDDENGKMNYIGDELWEGEGTYRVYSSDNNYCPLISDMWYYNVAPDNIEDAKYIVKCVNSHQALVEALKSTLSYMADPYTNKENLSPVVQSIIKKGKAALLLAGGESE